MLIDWFTVGVQILNFLVLVALLKHFLYGPILKAMGAREEKIAGHLHAARVEKRKARAEAESYRKRNADWEVEHTRMRAEAKEAADRERDARIGRVNEEADLIQAKWQEAVAQQKTAFLRDLRERVIREVYATTRRVLKDLADADLEQRITAVFIERLEAAAHDKWEEIGKALRENKNEVVIESAFDFSQEGREKIAAVFRKRFPEKAALIYKVEPDALCGVTLKVAGHKIAWDLNDYLKRLEEETFRYSEQKSVKKRQRA